MHPHGHIVHPDCPFVLSIIIVFVTRSPNPPGSGPAVVTWPKFTEEEQKYLVLDLKPRVEQRYRANKLAFWNEIVPKVFDNEKEKKKAYEN